MASFSKKPEGPAKSNTTKNLAAAGLAVVLAVIVASQFTKTRSTDAAVSPGAPAAAGPEAPPKVDETPEQAQAALDQELGKPVKAVEKDTSVVLDTPPADPFQLSHAWREKLIKPVAALAQTTVVEPTAVPVKAAGGQGDTKTTLPAWDPSGLKLTGIFRDNKRVYALINGSIMSEGMTVGGARIIEIGDDRVTVQQLGAPDSMRVDLVINRVKR